MISPDDSFYQKRLSLSQLSKQVTIEQAAESSSDEDELLLEKPASTFGIALKICLTRRKHYNNLINTIVVTK
jgi:hypothetical protein